MSNNTGVWDVINMKALRDKRFEEWKAAGGSGRGVNMYECWCVAWSQALEASSTGGCNMVNTNNGGPAFPGPYVNKEGGLEVLFKQHGMTLRDYFAAKALQGFAATLSGDSAPLFDILAKDAYEMADAMLKRREKP